MRPDIPCNHKSPHLPHDYYATEYRLNHCPGRTERVRTRVAVTEPVEPELNVYHLTLTLETGMTEQEALKLIIDGLYSSGANDIVDAYHIETEES